MDKEYEASLGDQVPCSISPSGYMWWPKVNVPPKPNENPDDTMKMYVLVNRSKLTVVQCGVQALHAAAEYSYFYYDNPTTKDYHENHKTVILLEATEDDIMSMAHYFKVIGKNSHIFKEPDLDDLITACAYEPISSTEGKILFSRFKLLR
jgi:hypothetical protein